MAKDDLDDREATIIELHGAYEVLAADQALKRKVDDDAGKGRKAGEDSRSRR